MREDLVGQLGELFFATPWTFTSAELGFRVEGSRFGMWIRDVSSKLGTEGSMAQCPLSAQQNRVGVSMTLRPNGKARPHIPVP